MSDNLSFLIEKYPNQKIILFGSSTHLLKNPKEINLRFFQNNRITLGESLNQKYQDQYYFIAFSGISGEKPNIFIKPVKLPDLHSKSIEYKYKDADLPIFLNKSISKEKITQCRFMGHSFLEMNLWKIMNGLVLIENIETAKIKKL